MTIFFVAVAIALLAAVPVALGLRRGGYGLSPALGISGAVGALVLALSAGWWFVGPGKAPDASTSLAQHRDNPERTTGDMAAAFEHELAARGDDVSVEELVLLARTFEAARDHEKAVAAYERANRKARNENADLLVAEAQARLNAPHADDTSMRRVRQRLEQALVVEPDHPGAHYYAGSIALQAGELAQALAHMEVVRASGLLEPEAEALLAERMAQWRAGLGDADVSDAAAAPGDAPAEALRVTVHAASGLDSGGTLFVFARVPDGPPMPVVARRVPAPELPLELTLTDADRLNASGQSLSSYPQLEVAARLSSSGDPAGAVGDPEARQVIDTRTTRSLRLELAPAP